MPSPDPRELASANVGSNIRPRSATRDLRSSSAWHLGKHTKPQSEAKFTQLGITGEFIRVFPAKAEFRNTEPNVTHVLTITVVNRSDKAKRIRFIPPKTREFTLHQIASIAVAPGLEMSADLEYFSEQDKDFMDEVTVMCESDRVTVPIFAYAPRAELHFDGYCLFGAVAPNQMVIRYVDLVNRGVKAADFTFKKKENLPFVIEPLSGRLGPEGSDDCFLRVKVSFVGEDLGVYRSVLEVDVNGTTIGTVLDISALVVRQQFEIVSPEGAGRIENVNFGTIYVGEERSTQVLLVNDGPDETDFRVVIPKIDGAETEQVLFTAEPSSGRVAPFEQQLVSFKYHPPRYEAVKGFKSKIDLLSQREEHQVVALFSNSSDDQQSQLKLSGRAVFPAVTFSEHELYFIDTSTNSNTELELVIKNHHDELPITFRSSKVAHFRCRPASGCLLPLQSAQIVVSFCPRQLGRHKNQVQFEITGGSGQVVGRATVMVVGVCDKEGARKTLAGGIKATDDTFKPTFHFQSPEDLRTQNTQGQEPFRRIKAWVKHPPEINQNTHKYTFGADKHATLDANKQVYQDFLKEQYERRNEVFTLAEGREFALGGGEHSIMCGDPKEDPDYTRPSLDMGLFAMPTAGYPPGAGLKEPRLVLPPANEPLYLKHRPDEVPAVIKPKSRVIDEDRLMATKFKPQPATARERRECQSILNARQIMQLSVHPTSMEFGSACVHADVSKCFAVSNDTGQHVLVSIDTHGNPILAHSRPESQVLPPGATAGFDITLYMEVEQKYDTQFTYTINGHHSFVVPVRAVAVPVMLSLSKSKVIFSFPSHSYQPTVTEVISIINPGNNPADFKIENSSANFSAMPSSGTVEALGSEEVTLTYRPGQTQKHEQQIKVVVVGGTDMTLTCMGEVDEGVIVCKQKTVDFGQLATGFSAHKTLTLHNGGAAPAVFFVDADELRAKCPGVSVTPDKGLLNHGESVQLIATVRSERAFKLDGPLTINVRGGKPIKCSVKADISIPVVELKTDELDFGSVYLGATSARQLTMANTSAIPAILTLDMRKFPEFTVHVPDELDFDDEEQQPAFASNTPSIARHADQIQEPEGPLVKFRIAPQAQGTIDLTYQPVSLAKHTFELPIVLQGMPAGSVKALRRVVVAEAIKPRMLMSCAAVDFNKRVVVNANMKGFSYNQIVTLTNCDDAPFVLTCKLKGAHAEQGFFKMEQVLEQTVGVSKSVTLKVNFIPRSDIEYRAKLTISLDNSSTPYFTLDVRGGGVFPSLGFDRREVMLPMVPTGQTTTVTFHVINHGYDNLNLRYQLPPESSSVPLHITFPQGMMIGVVKTHLPVEVSFVSTKSLSFTANIDFLDNAGNVFSIPVIGTTDACLLSVFPYLTIHKDSFDFDAKPGKPIMVQQIADLKEPYLAPTGDVMLDDGSDHSESRRRAQQANAPFLCECAVLTRKESVQAFLEWSNLNMFKQSVMRFPDDLVENRGKPLIDVIEASTGKTVPGQSRKVAANKKEEAQQVLQQYMEMLNTLKSYGALVNNVKAEYLLSWDMFQRLLIDGKAGTPQALLEEQRPWYDTYFSLVSGATWMMLLYQTMRLFVLNRLTPKLLKALPGVNQKLLPTSFVYTGSNVYSTAEVVLMQWLSYHHALVTPTDKLTVTNLDKDLHDCRVLASVVMSHVPSTKRALAGIKKTDTPKGRMDNATLVVAAFHSLGLDYCPTAADLCTAPARDMILFCLHLFNTMPGFIPKATISFEGRLNDGVQKHIELTNPSSKPLIYRVRIDGSSEFQCAEALRLGPKEKAHFPITVVHTARATAEAQIFFIGERTPGGAAGITMVFNLKSVVKTFKRSEVITKECHLYETITVDIPVKNSSTEMEKELVLSILDLTCDEPDKQPNAANPKAGMNNAARRKGASKAPGDQVTTSALLPSTTFFLRKDRIKLKKGAAATMQLVLLPLRLKGHSCLVFIKDESAGEICIEVQVAVSLPAATETIKFTHQMRTTVLKDVPLPVKNAGIDKCRATIMELMGQQAGKDWYKTISEQPRIDYKAQYLTEHCTGPRDVTVAGSMTGTKIDKTVSSQGAPSQNKLPLEIRPKGPGKYETRVILRSAFDVRVLDIECTITSVGTRAELIFTCAARQSISQEIPIINHSEQGWIISATLDGDHFTGGKDLMVPPLSDAGPGKASYMLTFSPSWICNVTGELVLRNTTIGDSYQYKLQGVGEEPVAEDHLVIECRARWRSSVVLSVRNIFKGKPIKYEIECDLSGVTGKTVLHVPADSEADYELNVMMPRGGTFTGSITFIAPNQEYIWYTFEVQAENPPSEKTVSLCARARTAVAADITIVNPLDSEISFDVIMQGEGLIGAPSVTLQPKESTVYELIYSPLMEGSMTGGLIFVNDEIGEFWYKLLLEAQPADKIPVQAITAELGKHSITQLYVENPLGHDIEGELTVSNTTNYSVSIAGNPYESVLTIPAYSKGEFDVVYRPSALGGEPETSEVVFHHPEAGTWIFECSGRGRPPGEMEVTQVAATVSHSSSNIVRFRNPLREPIEILVSLVVEGKSASQDAAFQLLLPSDEPIHLPPFREVDIPIMFSPSQMQEHACQVHVKSVADGLKWIYPVVGTAEASSCVHLGKFACKARECLKHSFLVDLSGAVNAREEDRADLQVITHPDHKEMLATALQVMVDDSLPRPPPGKCRIKLVFEPLKTIRTKVELKVSKASGGRWLFDFDLVSLPADIDDTIKIEGAINKTSTVAFRMKNQFDVEAPFRAYFMPESSPELSVAPTFGILDAYGGQGTEFKVSFAPKTYGKAFVGRLVVETDEMQWIYEVIGEHPKYQPPQEITSKVDARLAPGRDPTEYNLNKGDKNYLKANTVAIKRAQQTKR